MQTYHIPYRLTKKIAKKEHLMLKNALRLWFFCKTTDDLQHSFYINEARHLLLPHFSYKQINVYINYLVRHGWMGRDKYGKHFLRGRKHMFKVCEATSKMLAVTVLHEHTHTLKGWAAFLAAVQVCALQRNMQKFTNRIRTNEAATSKSGGEASRAVRSFPVSCQNICQTYGVSIATASRMRTRAHKAGLISNRWAFNKTHFKAASRAEWLKVRAFVSDSMPLYPRQRAARLDSALWPTDGKRMFQPDAINAEALLMSCRGDGWVYMQRPNMIANLGIHFRGLSNGKRKSEMQES